MVVKHRGKLQKGLWITLKLFTSVVFIIFALKNLYTKINFFKPLNHIKITDYSGKLIKYHEGLIFFLIISILFLRSSSLVISSLILLIPCMMVVWSFLFNILPMF